MTDFKIKRNDTSPAIRAQLLDGDDNPIDLTGADVKFLMADYNTGEVTVEGDCTIEDASEGIVYYSWAEGDTEEDGMYKAEFEATYADNTVETFPNDGYLTVEIDYDLA